jgi:hypothetical protein
MRYQGSCGLPGYQSEPGAEIASLGEHPPRRIAATISLERISPVRGVRHQPFASGILIGRDFDLTGQPWIICQNPLKMELRVNVVRRAIGRLGRRYVWQLNEAWFGLDMLAIESQHVVALRMRLIDEIQKDLYA